MRPGTAPVSGPQDRATISHCGSGAGIREGDAGEGRDRDAGLSLPGSASIRGSQDRARKINAIIVVHETRSHCGSGVGTGEGDTAEAGSRPIGRPRGAPVHGP